MKTLLKAEHLTKSYSAKKVLNDLSFHIYPGEIVGLLGPNGAGKTTAFYMTMGLIRPDKGDVYFKNQNITELPIHQRAQMGMGYLAQEPSIFRNLSVEDNILCILETLPLPKKEQLERLEALLQELHLTPLRGKKACTLSGGERRRLEITRALVTNPTLLLLDEPFANIDPITVADVKEMIKHLKSLGISVLITDHNARELSSVVDRAYLIQGGHVSHSGTIEELLAEKEARTSYFGEGFTL
ncbi:MAG: LPS export ABC transporter ATP-binding protein [Simkaniaceae bacterium]|nr:LPS export ABC transporter ATP-binding protein [Simkaniaceae bacterium]